MKKLISMVAVILSLVMMFSISAFASTATSITFTEKEYIMQSGATGWVRAMVNPEGATVTWSSSDTSVASLGH